MTAQLNIPTLRFPGFDGVWTNTLLGDIATFSKGKGISKADIVENGTHYCIRYGELYTTYSEVIDTVKSKTNIDLTNLILSQENDVIIPASGETPIDIATASCVARKGIALGGDLNIIKTSHNGIFLSYYLNNKRKLQIASLAQGNSVVHLYATQLRLLDINFPTLPEQQKIASFLSKVDEKLTQLKKKKELLEQYKKGMMQKIFSQEIRFKDDNGEEFADWEEKQLGEVFKLTLRPTEKPSQEYVALGVRSHFKGTFQKKDSDPSKIAMDTLYKVRAGDFIVNITFAWEGAVAIANREDDGTLVSHRFPMYVNNKEILNINFFRYLYPNNKFKGILELISPGGAGRNRVLKKDDFLKISLLYPSLPEQTKIAYFLSSLDKKITHTQTQIEKAELWKKGLLQQLFV